MGGRGGRTCGKLVAEQLLWVNCSAPPPPIEPDKLFGAVKCIVMVNGISAVAVVDTGSGISLLSKHFVDKNHLSTSIWEGPLITVVTGETFRIPLACEVFIDIFGSRFRGRCGVVENFSFDTLLGNDFLSVTPFHIDLRRLVLVMPEGTKRPDSSAPLLLLDQNLLQSVEETAKTRLPAPDWQ